MTLLYLHGFNSAPQSHKAQALKRYLEARGLGDRFVCPKLPHRPLEAIACAEREIALRPAGTVTLLGSSLGGFYATHLAEQHALPAVLLNPAVTPQLDLESYLGTQRNLYTGEAYELTREHIAEWRSLDTPSVHPERYLLIVETGDEVLDYREAVDYYAGALHEVVQGGDHSLVSFPEHIPDIVDWAKS